MKMEIYRHNFKNLEGQKFGRLLVVSRAGATKDGNVTWHCLCDCGRPKVIIGRSLRSGKTTSCGCYQREQTTVHGGCSNENNKRSITYTSFMSAKMRCRYPSNPSFPHYGGRGIRFKFKTFTDFVLEVGERPDLSHSLDRINPNGHYEKGNVRWASKIEQDNNRRSCVHININGEARTVSEWAKKFGINRHTAYNRIFRGWCAVCAVSIIANHGTCSHQ